MKIIDTFFEMHQCYQDGTFNIEQWELYAKNISTNFGEKIKNDIAEYDFNKDILPVLQELIHNEDKLITAHRSFCEIVSDLEGKIRQYLEIDIDVLIVFYLGLCNGAGWATLFEGKPAILLGVEKIVELSWYDKKHMQALIYHELGHIWHSTVRVENANDDTIKNQALWQIYSEGIAMYIEQILCEDKNFYHQNTEYWLEWCDRQKSSLYKEYIRRVDNNESIQCFFGDWNNYMGVSDVGYYLGCELIKELSKEYSLLSLANLDLFEIENHLRNMCN